MVNQELIEYVKHQLESGVGFDNVRTILLQNGWPQTDVEEVMRAVGSPGPVVPSPAGAVPAVAQSGVSTHVMRRVFFVLVGLIVAAGAVVGGVWAKGYYFPSPEQVVRKAAERLKDVTSSEYQIEATVDLKNLDIIPLTAFPTGTVPFKKMVFALQGASDIKDKENPKASFSFDFRTVPPQKTPSFSLDMRVVQKIIYIRLNGLPDMKPSFDVNTIENQWIKVDPEALAKQYGFEDQLKKAQEQARVNQVTAEKDAAKKIAQLRTALAANPFVKIAKEYPNDTIDGAAMYHYAYSFDGAAFARFAADIVTMFRGYELASGERENLSKILDAIDVRGWESWIGKGDFLPRKVIFEIGITPLAADGGTAKEAVVVNVVTTFKNYNQQVAIEAPTDMKDASEIIAMFMNSTSSSGGTESSYSTRRPPSRGGGFLNPSDLLEQSRDANRISDLSTLRSAISLYLADVNTPKLCEDSRTIYASAPITPAPGWKAGKNMGRWGVDGTGWLPINFREISSGAPLSRLGADPVNDPSVHLVYLYACDPKNLAFELNAFMESAKYRNSGKSDFESTDGGDDPNAYEVGNNLNLIPKDFRFK